jgi:hypothetical protein
MMDGSEIEAASALERARLALESEPSLRRRGIVAAGLADLKAAKLLVPRICELPIVSETEQYMTDYMTTSPRITVLQSTE